MLLNRIKLAKLLLKLASIATDKDELIYEGELREGIEVFVERDGEILVAEDGEYAAEDSIIVVSEGKVVEIRAIEKPEEEEVVVDNDEVIVDEQPKEDERDARIAELENKIAELEKLLGEKDDKIAELESELTRKSEELEKLNMSADIPAKEQVKKEAKTGALRYFN